MKGTHMENTAVLATTPSAVSAMMADASRRPGFTRAPIIVDATSGTAADRLGAITKGRWEDYKNRFVPIEDLLMQQTTYGNPALAAQEIGRAEADTGRTFDSLAGSSAIQLGRYGMSMTADQQASSDRINSLSRTGAVIDAANNIRLKLVERNQLIASGSAPDSIIKQG